MYADILSAQILQDWSNKEKELLSSPLFQSKYISFLRFHCIDRTLFAKIKGSSKIHTNHIVDMNSIQRDLIHPLLKNDYLSTRFFTKSFIQDYIYEHIECPYQPTPPLSSDFKYYHWMLIFHCKTFHSITKIEWAHFLTIICTLYSKKSLDVLDEIL